MVYGHGFDLMRVATVAKLREDGINVHLVSGDQNKAVQAIAAVVGIDRGNVASQQKPKEKQAYVAALMAQPGKVVMFCGGWDERCSGSGSGRYWCATQ